MKKWAMIFLAGLMFLVPAAAGAALITLDPSSQTIGVGGTADVDVNLSLDLGESLIGFFLTLGWDPASVLEFKEITFYSDPNEFVTSDTHDVVDGIGNIVLTGEGNPISEGGTLATLSFTGLQPGFADLFLIGSLSLELDEIALDYIPQANVNVVPEPGTMILLGSGLAGLAGWGRKRIRG